MSIAIGNKNWYYYLNNPGKTNLMMSDDYAKYQSDETFIVCWQIENSSKSSESEWTRVYTAFKSASGFYEFMRNTEPEKRCFFEIILGSKNQKPHFDVDINVSTLKEGVSLDAFADDLIKTLTSTISDNLQKTGTPKINVYTSHSKDKRSYHIVVENYYHRSNKEASAYYRQIVDKLPEHMRQYVDLSVYGPSQQFRLLGSSKFGNNRVKQTETNDLSKETFMNSLVSVVDVSKCLFVPLYSLTYDTLATPTAFSQSVKDAQNVLKSFYEKVPLNRDCFSITAVKNNMILLKRERSAFCQLCKRRHDHENAYLTTFENRGYYHCRRCGSEKLMFEM